MEYTIKKIKKGDKSSGSYDLYVEIDSQKIFFATVDYCDLYRLKYSVHGMRYSTLKDAIREASTSIDNYVNKYKEEVERVNKIKSKFPTEISYERKRQAEICLARLRRAIANAEGPALDKLCKKIGILKIYLGYIDNSVIAAQVGY